MKTEKQIIILLKSYETRRDNLCNLIDENLCTYWKMYEQIHKLTTKIETIKIILNK